MAERKCQNPDCGKPIPRRNKAFCSLECKGVTKRHPLAPKIWDLRRANPKISAASIAERLGMSRSAVMGLLYSRTDRPVDVPIDSPAARAARLQFEEEQRQLKEAEETKRRELESLNREAEVRDRLSRRTHAVDNTCIAPGCKEARDVANDSWYCPAHRKVLKK